MKIPATTAMCLLLLGLAACSKSPIDPPDRVSLSLDTESLPNGALTIPYRWELLAKCLPPTCSSTYTWSVTGGSLPTGLSLLRESGTGEIAGTPTMVGTFDFTVQVTTGAQSAQQALSISVNP